jgi:hypothetical protein
MVQHMRENEGQPGAMTATSTALRLAAQAGSGSMLARRLLPTALDAAHAELVAAGAPEAAELVVSACLRLANYRIDSVRL